MLSFDQTFSPGHVTKCCQENQVIEPEQETCVDLDSVGLSQEQLPWSRQWLPTRSVRHPGKYVAIARFIINGIV